MRNAAANFDEDFGYDEPRRPAPRKPRPASGKPKPKKKTGKRFGFDLRKVARYAAIGMSATVALGIMANALILQKGHHPAPLFGKAITLTETSSAEKTPAPVAVRTARDATATPAAEQDQTASIASLAAAPMPVAKPRHGTIPVAADQTATDDAIAKLLRGDSQPQATRDRNDTKTVMGAQKALAKLGFVLKPSGAMGPATRKAIETFEKERNLPVNGELSRRVVKILSAESGVKID